LEKGIIAGFPFTDVRVTVLGGKLHEVDSDSMDFQIAGSMAVRRAARRCGLAILEPIMRVDIAVDEEYLGTIIADLGRRRGLARGVEVQAQTRSVSGEVPLAEARGYATDLRDFTHGRGTFTLQFDRYDRVPEGIADDIIEQRREEGKIPRR
jgi:elongation factor G